MNSTYRPDYKWGEYPSPAPVGLSILRAVPGIKGIVQSAT
jgi:hypothetical protein